MEGSKKGTTGEWTLARREAGLSRGSSIASPVFIGRGVEPIIRGTGEVSLGSSSEIGEGMKVNRPGGGTSWGFTLTVCCTEVSQEMECS